MITNLRRVRNISSNRIFFFFGNGKYHYKTMISKWLNHGRETTKQVLETGMRTTKETSKLQEMFKRWTTPFPTSITQRAPVPIPIIGYEDNGIRHVRRGNKRVFEHPVISG